MKLSSIKGQDHLRPFVAIIFVRITSWIGTVRRGRISLPLDCVEISSLDGHNQVRTLLQRGMASVLLGKREEASTVARRVYDSIFKENLEDLEVHYEYNKLI